MSESDEEAVVTTATSSSMSGSSAMAVGAVGKQKSLFAGMGRVRHINHLREKWSGKPKSMMAPVRSFDANSASASSPTMMALRKTKKLHMSRKAANDSGDEADREPVDKRRRRTLSAMDMERFHTLSSWLEQNGIAIPQQSSHRWQHKQSHGFFENVQSPIAKADVFDDVYDALEILEKTVEGEISQLGPSPPPERQSSQDTHASKDYREKARETPSLFDYLVVIGPDVTDIAIQNYWHHEENVFEATVAFAWPPQSQFNAESIERFCFPSGISVLQHDQSENADASNAMNGDNFFVLMLSGGGAQGQSVQYASCMKGLITLPAINHDNVGGLVRVPVCYCLVSEMPFIPFSKNVLTRLLDDHRKDLEFGEEQRSLSSIVSNQHARMIDDALRRLQETPYPSRGCTVVAACFPSFDTELTLSRPREEEGADEKNTLLLQWSLPHLLSVLSIDRVLRIVRLLLLEMKVIVVSTKLTLLSSATLGIASLLHPLKWAGPLITILPPFLHEYMEAPVPLICGVDVLPSSYGCMKGTAIIHLESDEIEMHGEDERMFSQANLPGLNELAQNLAGLTKQLKDRSAISAFKTTHFAVDVVIRRVRRQIEHLLAICADLDAHKPFKSVNPNLEEQEFELGQ
uniref:UDENN domain-containing protein n=1 Tax=Globisporangium ultimum (strain ATCC 200006 / CBS 805.95 / DAOM BR144) TaxID=431595 RepID=K3XC59_GLOUD